MLVMLINYFLLGGPTYNREGANHRADNRHLYRIANYYGNNDTRTKYHRINSRDNNTRTKYYRINSGDNNTRTNYYRINSGDIF